tara:strand:- start:59 stop:328 length:270 start_codon:yes stop_codon:yes gene_type:complete
MRLTKDGEIRKEAHRKNARIIKWVIDILEGDIMSTNEILEGLRNIKIKPYGYQPKNLPSMNKLVSILYANPEFTRVNAKKDRPALWRLR